MNTITTFILGLLVELYNITGNLGLAIVVFTILVRTLLFPLSMGSLKAQKKVKELQPKLKELENKHTGSKADLQKAKMDLYKQYNVNPLSGCVPQLVQIGLFIVLYQVMVRFLGQTEFGGVIIDQTFLWLNLSKPDPTYVLPILTGVTQLVLSVMILPGGEIPDIVPNTSRKKAVKEANKKEENVADMAASMQKQMLFIMPVMTAFIALRFPSGLALYWIATTVFSIIQQLILSGPGGLTVYAQRALALRARFSSRSSA